MHHSEPNKKQETLKDIVNSEIDGFIREIVKKSLSEREEEFHSAVNAILERKMASLIPNRAPGNKNTTGEGKRDGICSHCQTLLEYNFEDWIKREIGNADIYRYSHGPMRMFGGPGNEIRWEEMPEPLRDTQDSISKQDLCSTNIITDDSMLRMKSDVTRETDSENDYLMGAETHPPDYPMEEYKSSGCMVFDGPLTQRYACDSSANTGATPESAKESENASIFNGLCGPKVSETKANAAVCASDSTTTTCAGPAPAVACTVPASADAPTTPLNPLEIRAAANKPHDNPELHKTNAAETAKKMAKTMREAEEVPGWPRVETIGALSCDGEYCYFVTDTIGDKVAGIFIVKEKSCSCSDFAAQAEIGKHVVCRHLAHIWLNLQERKR